MDLIAIGKVKHNGKWYDRDAKIKKVKKEEGERLIKMGVAKEIDSDAAEAKAKAEEEAKNKAEEEAKRKAAEEAEKEKKEAEAKAKEVQQKKDDKKE